MMNVLAFLTFAAYVFNRGNLSQKQEKVYDYRQP